MDDLQDEKPKPKIISDRDFLKLVGIGTLSLILAACSSNKEVNSSLEVDISNNYVIKSVERNKSGLIDVEFFEIDNRGLMLNDEEFFWKASDYAPFGSEHISYLSSEIIQRTLEVAPDFSKYDHIFLVSGQFFPSKEGYKRHAPRSIMDISSGTNINLKTLGGVNNLNVGELGQTELNYLLAHESMHTLLTEYPTKIVTSSGEEIPFSHDGSHLVPNPIPIDSFRYYHPHSDILGGGNETQVVDQQKFLEDALKSISPINLFTLGLITSEEFEKSFDGGGTIYRKNSGWK